MKNFIFTVDDNIRFLKELTEGSYSSAFEHPYLAMYKRLHEKYGLRVQLNLFYELGDFDLSQVTDRYREEFRSHSDWLKMSFHSRLENVRPYENSDYDEVFRDCQNLHRQILRFASAENLGRTTTLHYCLATPEGLRAMGDNGVIGLLGLYGTESSPKKSYQSTNEQGDRIRRGELVKEGGISYGGIDIVLNLFSKDDILSELRYLLDRELVKIMIHEQYFYPDYRKYQADFEEKLDAAFELLVKNNFESAFFEDIL